MAFHVLCSGADLVRRLSKDATKFFHEPFALFVIVLATEIDHKVLDWLAKWEMAIDSMAGDAVAFLMFFNKIKLDASAGMVSWSYGNAINDNPSSEDILRKCGLWDTFIKLRGKHSDHFDSLEELSPHPPACYAGETIHMNVDSQTLRLGKEAVDMQLASPVYEVLEQRHPDLSSQQWARFNTSNGADKSTRIFVESMTYESDRVAAMLGINELPCFVFIDDLESNGFSILPLGEPDDKTIHDLRDIFQSFLNSKENRPYFDKLNEWKRLNIHMINLAWEVHGKVPIIRNIRALFKDARKNLNRGNIAAFRANIEGASALSLPYIDKVNQRIRWAEIDPAIDEIKILSSHRRTIYKAAYRLKTIYPKAQAQIGLALNYAATVLPNLSDAGSRKDLKWVDLQLASLIGVKVESVMVNIVGAFGDYGQAVGAQNEEEYFSKYAQMALEVKNQMDGILSELTKMPRPEIRKHISMALRKKYRRKTLTAIKSGASGVVKLTEILRVILEKISIPGG